MAELAAVSVSQLTSINFWADLSQIVGLLIAVAAILAALKQLKTAARTAHAQLVLMLDDALYNYEDIRACINGSDPDDVAVRTRRYVAIFERMGILLRTRQIDLVTIDQLYGSRIEKMLRNPAASQMLQADPDGWQVMIFLWKRLHKAGPTGPGRHWLRVKRERVRHAIPAPPELAIKAKPLAKGEETSGS